MNLMCSLQGTSRFIQNNFIINDAKYMYIIEDNKKLSSLSYSYIQLLTYI